MKENLNTVELLMQFCLEIESVSTTFWAVWEGESCNSMIWERRQKICHWTDAILLYIKLFLAMQKNFLIVIYFRKSFFMNTACFLTELFNVVLTASNLKHFGRT